MCTAHIFNWYMLGNCLYGDLCIRQGSDAKYEAYVKYKLEGKEVSHMFYKAHLHAFNL